LKIKYQYIILVILGGLLLNSCNTTKLIRENELLLKKIKIEGIKHLSADEITPYIKQKPNRTTAFIFPFHLWIYNISHETNSNQKPKKWKKWLGIYRMGEIIGEPPVIWDSISTKKSIKKIQQFLKNKGYYFSEITDSISSKNKKATITYHIKEGDAYQISSIQYQINNPLIKSYILQDTSHSLLKKGTLLDVDFLQKERERITAILKTHGYFKFSKEFIYFKIDTSFNNFSARLFLNIANTKDSTVYKQYRINNIYYYQNFEPKEFLKNKKIYLNYFDTAFYKGDFYLSKENSFINKNIIKNSSYLKKGALYNSDDISNTFRKLSSLRSFKLINIRYNEIKDSTKIDVLVQMTPFNKHNYTVEVEGTNSSGNLGAGGRISYQHKSLFGGAEILNMGLYGRLETQHNFVREQNNISFNTQEIGLTTSLHFPRFLVPFKADRFIKKNIPRTALEFDINYKNRPEYSRSIYNGSFGYYWKNKNVFFHQLKILDISAIKVFNLESDYYNLIKDTYLEKSFENHLVEAINYRLLYTKKKTVHKKNYFSLMMFFESAGNLLQKYSQLTNAPQKDGSYLFLNNIFSQYWKNEIDFRYYHILTRKTDKLVYRAYTGIAIPYGNVNAIPYIKQFFAGGANSLRAWPIRSLGPGSFYNPERKYYNEASDFKLEGNIEYRFKLFWLMEGALFLDAGNIWAINKNDLRTGAQFKLDSFYKQIALGTGFGLRFDFSFFIFRFDYGIQLRDPKEEAYNRWLPAKEDYNPFSQKYSMLNFGIGYPF